MDEISSFITKDTNPFRIQLDKFERVSEPRKNSVFGGSNNPTTIPNNPCLKINYFTSVLVCSQKEHVGRKKF